MRAKNTNFHAIAIFLILAEPFIEHAYTNRFVFEPINLIILLGFAAVAAALALLIKRFPNRALYAVIMTGLITLFLDIRANMIHSLGLQALLVVAACLVAIWFLYAHASKILIVVFGVFSVFVVTLPVHPQTEKYAAARTTGAPSADALPAYIHIVLDEFIGAEALDETDGDQRALKRAMQNFFVGNGFRLYGRAYSQYFDTKDALPALFNAYSGPEPRQFYDYRTEAFNRVSLNAYLRAKSEIGYGIRAYQTAFLDFCGNATDIIESCLTYSPFWGASSDALRALGWRDKLTVTLAALWRRSTIVKSVRDYWRRGAALIAGAEDAGPARELDEIFMLGAIPSQPVFDRLIADVAASPSNTLFFAHLMTPHHPYSLAADCRIRRPLLDWRLNAFPVALASGEANTDASRTVRYADYADQAQCALLKLQVLFGALRSAGAFDGATIVIHSDHGSKISRFRVRKALRERLSERDYFDGFSTLFAVKAPHIAPGYDLTMLPLDRLLAYASDRQAAVPEQPAEHVVYLRDEPTQSDFVEAPMPEIPVGSIRPPRNNGQ